MVLKILSKYQLVQLLLLYIRKTTLVFLFYLLNTYHKSNKLYLFVIPYIISTKYYMLKFYLFIV